MEEKKKQFKASTICYTAYVNEHTEEEVIKALKEDGATWILHGYEICPTTGRKHLQGMAHAKLTITWGHLTKLKVHREKTKFAI